MAGMPKIKNEMDVNLNIFITPMLDMAFQLLAFFIMFYRPGLLIEGYVSGKLLPPEKVAAQSKEKKEEDVTPQDIEPEITEKVTLFIRSVAPGQYEGDRGPGDLSMLQIKTKVDDEPTTIADSTESVEDAINRLKQQLKKIRDGPGGNETTIHLQPDANLKYENVVTIWNVCRASRFEVIGFGAPANGNK